MTGQIVFDLEKKDNFSVDDFIISETNNEVTSTLENMDQLINKCAIVYGPKKSGKTQNSTGQKKFLSGKIFLADTRITAIFIKFRPGIILTTMFGNCLR